MLCPSMLQHLVVFCFTSSVVLATYDTDVTTTSDQVSFPDSMINDLLKFKGIVRNLKVRRECQKQLANDVNKCQQQFEFEIDTLKKNFWSMKNMNDMRFCCAIYQHHKCVIDAANEISHYFESTCLETDLILVDEALNNLEFYWHRSLKCPLMHKEHVICENSVRFLDKNFFTLTVMLFGLVALMVALILSGYTVYLSRVQNIRIFRPKYYDQEMETFANDFA